MKNFEYYEILKEQMDRQIHEEKDAIEEAAHLCAEAIMNDRVIHAFGCGHSQMFGMEIFYRAGGLVPVNAIIHPHLSLSPKAKLSTFVERVEGFSQELMKLENTDPKDVMIITSMSGRNGAVVDMAMTAKEIGMKVITLTSVQFSDSVESRHSSGKKVKDLADVIIDIKCVPGDAVLEMEGMPEKFNGTSTILGTFVMNLITSRAIELMVEQGYIPPTFVSANTDRGDAINAKHIQKYKGMIGCL